MQGMYICVCHAVTERTLRKAVRDGASSINDLSYLTGCGTQCGSCVQSTREILDSELNVMGQAPSVVELKVVAVS